MPEVLYEEVVEIDERVVFKQDRCDLGKIATIVTGTTREKVRFCLLSFVSFKRKIWMQSMGARRVAMLEFFPLCYVLFSFPNDEVAFQ